MNLFSQTAYAKINLALHIRGRRSDGFHDIETVFAFVDRGDELMMRPSAECKIELSGEFASGLEADTNNLVMRAVAALPFPDVMAAHLQKNIPVAAGLGGGSADAGAVFRVARDMGVLPENWRDIAAKLGADISACVDSQTCSGTGTGATLQPLDSDLAGTPILLANPRLPLTTGPVFAAWDGVDNGPMPSGTAREIALAGRNDLEKPAISLCREIGELLEILGQTNSWLVRMSGSGASCFALYEDSVQRDHASAILRSRRPGWWQMAGNLR